MSLSFNADELALLHRVARLLLREGERGELLAALLDAVIEGLGADRGFVVVREGQQFRATVARNFRSEALTRAEEAVSSSIARAVIEQNRALLLGDALTTDSFRHQPSVKQLGLRSVLCAPLAASQKVFALIYLENREVANSFTTHHLELLDEICAMAAPRLRAAVAVEQAKRRVEELELSLGEFDGIITADATLAGVLKTAKQIAPTDLPVLIQGETGTGKELIARVVYRHSARVNSAFLILNCAAIPATLIESELFGYVQGAFTGATRDRTGFVGAAHRGTLFLDEVGDLPLELQPRLLRVLQSGEFTRLGSVRSETADVRFIAATNRDLLRDMEEGKFRSDLYYRLSAVTLTIPSLRDRPHDVRLLIEHFRRAYATRYGREAPFFGEDCMGALSAYSFPGNVRELESEVARLVAVSQPGAVLGVDSLNERIRAKTYYGTNREGRPNTLPPMSLAEMEKQLIVAVLAHTGGNRTRAAETLGISREGLRTKMQRLGISETQ